MSQPSYAEIAARLTAPGSPFALAVETVHGRSAQCFAKRERSLREKVENAGKRGDAICMVHGERRISYAEFAQRVWGAARALARDHGLAPGDRLAVHTIAGLEPAPRRPAGPRPGSKPRRFGGGGGDNRRAGSGYGRDARPAGRGDHAARDRRERARRA